MEEKKEPCKHFQLHRCVVGCYIFWKCRECGANFTIEPMVIKVLPPS